MKLDANRLALACGGVTAVFWVICYALVAVIPEPMMAMTMHMLHADLQDISWSLSGAGFFVGLISWTIAAALAGWLVAWTYNRLGNSSAK